MSIVSNSNTSVNADSNGSAVSVSNAYSASSNRKSLLAEGNLMSGIIEEGEEDVSLHEEDKKQKNDGNKPKAVSVFATSSVDASVDAQDASMNMSIMNTSVDMNISQSISSSSSSSSSSSALVAGVGNSAKSNSVGKISFSQFVEDVGLDLNDDAWKSINRRDSEFGLAGKMRRISMADSLAGTGSNGQKGRRRSSIASGMMGTGAGANDGETDIFRNLEDILYAACVDAVETEDYGQGCLMLLDITEQTKDTLKKMEDWMDANQPEALLRLQSLHYQEKKEDQVNEIVWKLKKKSTANAAVLWYKWRQELLQGTRNHLEEQLHLLSNDAKHMSEMAVTLDQLRQTEETNNNPSIIAMRATVVEQCGMIEQYIHDKAALEDKMKQVMTEVSSLNDHKEKLALESQRLKLQVSKKVNPVLLKEQVIQQQNNLLVLQSLMGWHPVSVQISNIQLVYQTNKPVAHKSKYSKSEMANMCVLTAHCDSEGKMKEAPKLFLHPDQDSSSNQAKKKSSDENGNLLFNALFNSSSPYIDSLLRDCKSSNGLPALTTQLNILLGRIIDIVTETNRISEKYTMFPIIPANFSSGSTKLEITITNAIKMRQVVVTLNISASYPDCSFQPQLEFIGFEKPLEAEIIKGQILTMIESENGYGRLTRICKNIDRLI
jgi:hypothetical protein